MNLKLDRRLFIASLGGAAAVSMMSDEAKADALEDAMSEALDAAADDAEEVSHRCRGGSADRDPG